MPLLAAGKLPDWEFVQNFVVEEDQHDQSHEEVLLLGKVLSPQLVELPKLLARVQDVCVCFLRRILVYFAQVKAQLSFHGIQVLSVVFGDQVPQVVVEQLEVVVGFRGDELGEVLVVEQVLVPVDGLCDWVDQVSRLLQNHLAQGLVDHLHVIKRLSLPALHQLVPSVHHENDHVFVIVILHILASLVVVQLSRAFGRGVLAEVTEFQRVGFVGALNKSLFRREECVVGNLLSPE